MKTTRVTISYESPKINTVRVNDVYKVLQAAGKVLCGQSLQTVIFGYLFRIADINFRVYEYHRRFYLMQLYVPYLLYIPTQCAQYFLNYAFNRYNSYPSTLLLPALRLVKPKQITRTGIVLDFCLFYRKSSYD